MPRGIAYESSYPYSSDWTLNKTKVKTLGDVDIYVDQDGTFWAKFGGNLRKRKSLRDLEKLILRQNAPLKCFSVNNYAAQPTHDCEIVAIEPDNRYRSATNNLMYFHSSRGPFLDDPALRAEIDDLVKRRETAIKEFDAQYQELLTHGVRPTRDDLDRAREADKEAATDEPD